MSGEVIHGIPIVASCGGIRSLVQIRRIQMYCHDMDVAISALRAELSSWLDRVREGEEIVVTERGVPVARLTPIDSAPRLAQLVRDGVLSKPERESRPRAEAIERVQATEPVSSLVAEQRRLRGL